MRLAISIFRALCAMLVGFLLLSNPEEMTPLLLQIIGGLFAVMGLTTLISHYVNRFRYHRARKRAEAEGVTFIDVQPFSPATPFVAIGSIAFGILLFLFPEAFVVALMYVLGGLLILVGLSQGFALISARHVAPLGWSLLLFPVLLIGAGVFVVSRPVQAAALPFIILGAAYILYGVAEFCLGIRFHRYRRIFEAAMAEAEAATQPAAIEPEFIEAEEVTEERGVKSESI